MRLRDLALDDRERSFYGPRTGDWLLMGLMVVILLGNGAYIWHQTGAGSHVGRAVFFGLVLLCMLWSALVYTFKLSVCVRVGPQGLSVVRGPWRTELPWREAARLTERTQLIQGQRYRWLVALARDGRKMQIRDDMVDDYARFRIEVNERYRLWRDHGGTWGTTGGGPYTARETLAGQTLWAAVGAAALALPAAYFLVLLPETDPLGWLLLALAALCAIASLRGLLRRATYIVDAKAIEVRQKASTLKLAWRNVVKVDRTRHAFGGIISVGIAIGRFALKLVARTDGRVESFDWAPRVPEYLTLRGGGHQVRVRLHRLERPDELLAWVEFYERVGRRVAESEPARKTGGPTRRLALESAPDASEAAYAEQPYDGYVEPDDLTDRTGPVDPWGAGRDGEPETDRVPALPAEEFAGEDSWLRSEPVARRPMPPEAEQPRQTAAPAMPPFTPHAADDSREQSFSGLDIFASKAARNTSPPSSAASEEHAAPPARNDAPPEHRGHLREPGEWSSTSEEAPPYDPRAYQPAAHEWQTSRTVESWEPAETASQSHPISPEREPAVFAESWLDDEVEPNVDEHAPAETSGSLADSFAPWRDDASWQPPQLPRFGPPPPDAQREE